VYANYIMHSLCLLMQAEQRRGACRVYNWGKNGFA